MANLATFVPRIDRPPPPNIPQDTSPAQEYGGFWVTLSTLFFGQCRQMDFLTFSSKMDCFSHFSSTDMEFANRWNMATACRPGKRVACRIDVFSSIFEGKSVVFGTFSHHLSFSVQPHPTSEHDADHPP